MRVASWRGSARGLRGRRRRRGPARAASPSAQRRNGETQGDFTRGSYSAAVVSASSSPARRAAAAGGLRRRQRHREPSRAADFALTADPSAAAWKGVAGVVAEKDRFGKAIPGHRTEIRSRWTDKNVYLPIIAPYEDLYVKPDPTTTPRRTSSGTGTSRRPSSGPTSRTSRSTRNSRSPRRRNGSTSPSTAARRRPSHDLAGTPATRSRPASIATNTSGTARCASP